MEIEIKSLVVCDEVRREISHKDIIIGAYGSGITVHSLPTAINLSLWIEFQAKKQGSVDLYLRVAGPSSQQQTNIKVSMEIGQDNTGQAIYTPPLQIAVAREGSLKFYAKTGMAAKLELLKSMKVSYTPMTDVMFGPPSAADTPPIPEK